MSNVLDTDVAPAPTIGRSRVALLRRLIDTVALPSSSIPPQERALAGDILLDMLFHVSDDERLFCAERLKNTTEAPRRLMRYLGHCRIEVARTLLEENTSFDPSDLADLIRTTTVEHRMVIAGRRSVSIYESDVLVEFGEIAVMRVLLANQGASLSELAMDRLMSQSQQEEALCELLLQRPEFTASQALAMFWWAPGLQRRSILTKYSADRKIVIDRCFDAFEILREEGWQDPVARKAAQMIERRQRNRQAQDRSSFENLEEAVETASKTGMTPELTQEIGYLSGMKPIAVAKLFSDPGGEGVAVLCKATGLRREHVARIWHALRRPVRDDQRKVHPILAYVIETYDLMSVARAQTVLRYWNWSLTASGTSDLVGNDMSEEDVFSPSKRAARLVFGR
ncbi:MAG: DUF2336 domain-containing protein [Pseudomonadota bacterium]